VGFVCDHIEILYDIDVAFREYGRTRGVTVHRAESLNESPLLIQALATVVRERTEAVHSRQSAVSRGQ
jgi:ferrochelatase